MAHVPSSLLLFAFFALLSAFGGECSRSAPAFSCRNEIHFKHVEVDLGDAAPEVPSARLTVGSCSTAVVLDNCTLTAGIRLHGIAAGTILISNGSLIKFLAFEEGVCSGHCCQFIVENSKFFPSGPGQVALRFANFVFNNGALLLLRSLEINGGDAVVAGILASNVSFSGHSFLVLEGSRLTRNVTVPVVPQFSETAMILLRRVHFSGGSEARVEKNVIALESMAEWVCAFQLQFVVIEPSAGGLFIVKNTLVVRRMWLAGGNTSALHAHWDTPLPPAVSGAQLVLAGNGVHLNRAGAAVFWVGASPATLAVADNDFNIVDRLVSVAEYAASPQEVVGPIVSRCNRQAGAAVAESRIVDKNVSVFSNVEWLPCGSCDIRADCVARNSLRVLADTSYSEPCLCECDETAASAHFRFLRPRCHITAQLHTYTVTPERSSSVSTTPSRSCSSPTNTSSPTLSATQLFMNINLLRLVRCDDPHVNISLRTTGRSDQEGAGGQPSIQSPGSSARSAGGKLEVHVDASDIRQLGFSFSLLLRSCHTFRPITADSAPPFLIPTRTGSSTGSSSLLHLLVEEPDAIKQLVALEGRELRVAIPPLPWFEPPESQTLVLALRPDATAPPLALVNESSVLVTVHVRQSISPKGPTDGTAVQTAQGGAGVGIGALSGFVGLPALAATSHRQAVINAIASCPVELSEKSLPVDVSPLQLKLGGRPLLAVHVGAVVGNALLLGACLLLHVLGACIAAFVSPVTRREGQGQRRRRWAFASDLLHGISLVRFPGRTVFAAFLLVQGSVSSGVVLVAKGVDSWHFALGGGSLIFYGAMAVLICTPLFASFKKSRFAARFWEHPDLANRSLLRRLTGSCGHWVPADWTSGLPPAQRVAPGLRREAFLRTLGPLFEDLKPSSRFFFVLDVAVLITTSLLLGLLPATHLQCTLRFVALVITLGVYLIAFLIMRPFTVHALNLFFGVVHALQWVSSLALLLAQESGGPRWLGQVSERASSASLGVQAVLLCWALGKGARGWYVGDAHPNKEISRHGLWRHNLELEARVRLMIAFDSVTPPGIGVALSTATNCVPTRR